MLKTRILTAVVIAAVAFTVVFAVPSLVFAVCIAALLLAACREFAPLAGLRGGASLMLVLVQTLLFGLMWYFWVGLSRHAVLVLTMACLSWCLLLMRLHGFDSKQPLDRRYRLMSVLSALTSLSCAGFSLVWLHQQQHGEFLVLVLLLIIWAADIGAYFVGRAFGQTKLAPRISPGKTREGLFGGVMLALMVAYLAAEITGVMPSQAGLFVLLTAITALAAAGGDLLISLHKRSIGVKDSGRLFPGHGGVLDRFDSLLAGAPFFALGIMLLSDP